MEGAREGGACGLCKGIGTGVCGLVVRPISGTLDGLALGTQNMGSGMDKWAKKAQKPGSPLRYRRALVPRGVVTQYDARLAIAQHVLHVKLGRNQDDLLWASHVSLVSPKA